MSQDYRLPEFNLYLHMNELQPAPAPAPPPRTPHYPYPMQQHQQPMNNQSAASSYEMTAASAGTACAEGTLPPALSAQTLHPLDPRKRKNSHFGDYEMSDVQCSGSERSVPAPASITRKRKSSSYGSASAYDDDCCDDSRSSRTTLPDKKQNHSEIEKRRRDKMNTYITELSAMIPMCGAMARKLDKLTVLRMAVQHLRSVRGSLSAGPLAARPRPAFLSERELNGLLLQAASDAFLVVVGCDRGRLLYVSHSVAAVLHYDQAELLGQSMFDILHPKDVAKVKEQLSSSDLSPRERLIDAKTMLPVKSDVVAGAQRLCPGARRSFFCRIKCKQPPAPAPAPPPHQPLQPLTPAPPVKEEADVTTKHRKKNEKKYCVVQCTGYLKSWAPADVENGSGAEGDEEQATMSCLVAIGRALPDLAPPAHAAPPAPPPHPAPPAPAPSARHLQYVSRHAIDGKFLFVDQRVTLALGFLPQELLGTSLYEYVSGPELGAVARTHKQALLRRGAALTPPYACRRKDGATATLQTHFKPFRNPWTKEVECLVANNSVVADAPGADDVQLSYEAFKQTDEWRDYLTGIKGALKEDGDAAAPFAGPGTDPGPGIGPGPGPGARDPAGCPRSSEGAGAGAGAGAGGAGDAEVQRLIDSQVESHKIGSAIAEEALRRPHSAAFSPPALLLQDPVFNASSLVDNILGVDLSAFTSRGGGGGAALSESPPARAPPASPPPMLGIDGNGEAAMAVIMSLLEADAGLGGPVNFSGLPWPLP